MLLKAERINNTANACVTVSFHVDHAPKKPSAMQSCMRPPAEHLIEVYEHLTGICMSFVCMLQVRVREWVGVGQAALRGAPIFSVRKSPQSPC